MKLINKTRRCSSCGCISFPDSRVCPKCGKSHIETGIVGEPASAVDSARIYGSSFNVSSLNQSVVINIRDNITISITERQLVQVS
jgi:hypothetical protein